MCDTLQRSKVDTGHRLASRISRLFTSTETHTCLSTMEPIPNLRSQHYGRHRNPPALFDSWIHGRDGIGSCRPCLAFDKDIRRFLPQFQYMMCDRSCLTGGSAYDRRYDLRRGTHTHTGTHTPPNSIVRTQTANRGGSSSDPSPGATHLGDLPGEGGTLWIPEIRVLEGYSRAWLGWAMRSTRTYGMYPPWRREPREVSRPKSTVSDVLTPAPLWDTCCTQGGRAP